MKRILLSTVILAVALGGAMAGIETDKVVFPDETELTTATLTPPTQNTNTTELTGGGAAVKVSNGIKAPSIQDVDSNLAASIGSGAVEFGSDFRVGVYGGDDAEGTNGKFVYFCISGNHETNGTWRLGIDASNLVVQVYVTGQWTNATEFVRP